MSSQIQLGYRTGFTLYAVIQRTTDGKWWNTATVPPAFETFNAAHWADYAIPFAEIGVIGTYAATFPVAILTPALCRVEVRQQAGGSPAVSDLILGDGGADSGEIITRLLGLAQENWVFRNPVYAGTNLVSAAVRLYDSAAHATLDDGTTGLLGEYALTAVYDHGKLVKTTQVKV